MKNETIKIKSEEMLEMMKDDFCSLVHDAMTHHYATEKELKDCVYPKLMLAKFEAKVDFLAELFNEFPSVLYFAEDYAEHWESENAGTKEEWLEWFEEAFYFDRDTRLDRN